MSDDRKRIRVSLTGETEESWDYKLPAAGPEFMAKIIELVTEIPESRLSAYGAYGVGIEIRRIPVEHSSYGFQEAFTESEEPECEIGCTCIMCIPGA